MLLLLASTNLLPPPALFAVLAFVIYVALKSIVLWDYVTRHPGELRGSDYVVWYFGWPGMDARDIFRTEENMQPPRHREWGWAVIEVLFGGLLMFIVAPWVLPRHELIAGWIAMAGFAFTFNFGILQLAALGWRRAGRPVEPIMNAPILAKSLDEFWGRRWNLAFHDFTRSFVLKPMLRRFGGHAAVWASFVFSGLVHEAAISTAAWAGFGLPTLYFLLQGGGMFVERSPVGRRVGLGRGLRGWMFTAILTAAPAWLLFHPPFIRAVIVPLIPSLS